MEDHGLREETTWQRLIPIPKIVRHSAAEARGRTYAAWWR